MTRETFHDRWSPGTPVRWSPADSKDPDMFLSVDDAARRLARVAGTAEAAVVKRLIGGRERIATTFATYEWVPAEPVAVAS